MAYICYRIAFDGCKNCEHFRMDPERGSKLCFAGKEAPIEESYFNFLERVRIGGSINMYDACTPLMEEFKLTQSKAREVLTHWMNNYDELAEKYRWIKEEN